MRSISSHWAQGRKHEEISASALETEDEEGNVKSPLDDAASDAPGGDELLISQEELEEMRRMVERIEDTFADDPAVMRVIECIREGFSTGPEIRELLGITQTEYETTMKRLRRGARRMLEGRDQNG
jgi:hypothetical protein